MDEVRESILTLLATGMSLVAICQREGMPCTRTVQRWQNDDAEFDVAVTRAREDGYALRADKAVENAAKATDASLARLAFDAERWYLGKLSNAFNENKPQEHKHSGQVGVRLIEIQFGRGTKAPE